VVVCFCMILECLQKKEEEQWKKYVTYGLVAVGAIGITAGAYYYFNYYDPDAAEDKDDLDDLDDKDHNLNVKQKSNLDQRKVKIVLSRKMIFIPHDDHDEKRNEFDDHHDGPNLRTPEAGKPDSKELHDEHPEKSDKKVEEDDDQKLLRYRSKTAEVNSWPTYRYKHGTLVVKSIQLKNLDDLVKVDAVNVYVTLTIDDQEPKLKKETTKIIKKKDVEWAKPIKLEVKNPIRSSLKIKVRNQTSIFGTSDVLGGTLIPIPLVFNPMSKNKIICDLTIPAGRSKILIDMAYEEK